MKLNFFDDSGDISLAFQYNGRRRIDRIDRIRYEVQKMNKNKLNFDKSETKKKKRKVVHGLRLLIFKPLLIMLTHIFSCSYSFLVFVFLLNHKIT